MTTSRVVRGTKARIFIYICAILIVTGVIACYNNTLSQLDDVRKASDQCHQQQENLSTQLQVIFDYKQRLEKSLKTEKTEHQHARNDYEAKLSQQRESFEKTSNEAKLRLTSLQQHYNLLQTQHDDFKDESARIQQEQLNTINDLQGKLKEVQGQLKKGENDHQNSYEHLKAQFHQLKAEKEKLEETIKSDLSCDGKLAELTRSNTELTEQLTALKAKYHLSTSERRYVDQIQVTTQNISQQVKIDEDEYQIQDKNKPIAENEENNNQLAAPKFHEIHPQFNNSQYVLAVPGAEALNVSPKSSTKSSVSKPSLDVVQPLKVPTATPDSKKKLSQEANVLPYPYAQKRLPQGVVPVPDKQFGVLEESRVEKRANSDDKNTIADDVNDALPNRYRNNIIDNEIANEAKARNQEKQDQIEERKDTKQSLLNDLDKDNNALEIFDAPNQVVPHVAPANLKFPKQHIDTLGMANEKLGDKRVAKMYEGHDGLDYDKDQQNDMQLEENEPEGEEDDDADDYGGHIERQKDPAVRN